MDRIYFDNAATSYPKPPEVTEAVCRYMTDGGANIGRGSYQSATAAAEAVFELRESLCRLFHAPDPKNVVFTKNITESLNVLLRGLLHPGDEVIASSIEHNAVLRPLAQLEKGGVVVKQVPCRPDGSMDPKELFSKVGENTRVVVLIHGSNVCGTLLPVAEVGELCHKRGIFFVLDTAQTAGVEAIDMEAMHIDAVAFTGHKGLLGPQGTGGIAMTDAVAAQLEPLILGGTGSQSHLETMPPYLPDRFEAGTLNLPGLMGLRAAVQWLEKTGIEAVRTHEKALTSRFLSGILPLEEGGRLRIIGRHNTSGRIGVVSLVPTRGDPAALAYELERQYGNQTRVGLHCAPAAHKTLGTFPAGTLRFSFGWYNTPAQMDLAAEALFKLT